MMSIPSTYAEAQDWLTYPEWLRLYRRGARLAENSINAFDFGEFQQRLTESSLKASVQKTLLYMADWCDSYGWSCISKARVSAALGISLSTVKRHWKAARDAGFLRSLDYPADQRRTSDHWLLWPDLGVMTGDPGLDYMARLPETYWESYETQVTASGGVPPF